MSDDRPIGYWDQLSTGSESLLDLLAAASGEEWTVRGAAVTGEDGETLFALCLRHRVGDPGLLIRLGYAVVDLSEPEDPVSWTDNLVDMRVQGSLPSALSLFFDEDGMGDPADPTALDARKPSPEEDPDVLRAPWREISTAGEFEETEIGGDPDQSEERDPKRSVDGSAPDSVTCQKCGEDLPREEAVNFGSVGVGGDAWIHEGGCPQ